MIIHFLKTQAKDWPTFFLEHKFMLWISNQPGRALLTPFHSLQMLLIADLGQDACIFSGKEETDGFCMAKILINSETSWSEELNVNFLPVGEP